MAPTRTLQVHATLAEMVSAGVTMWQALSQIAVQNHGRFTVALSGGSTPKWLYEALVQASGIPWTNTWVAWGDERYVPADHPDSNYYMAKRALLDHVGIPPSQIFPWPTTSRDPAHDALRYETTLRSIFATEWPQWDLMLLGMGDDGHTASLFPGTDALSVTDRWTTVGVKNQEPRLTLTFPAINHSQQVLICLAGAGKETMVQRVLTTAPALPIQQVKPQGSLTWMMDAAAAQRLPWATAI